MGHGRDRPKQQFARALKALLKGDLEAADRHFRASGSLLGVAVTAVHAASWERALGKAMEFLDIYDALPAGHDDRNPEDESLALRVVEMALERIDRERLPEAGRLRVHALADRGCVRLARADWATVRRHVRKSADRLPKVYGPLATERVGRRLVRDTLAKAADLLLLSGHCGPEAILAEAGRLEPDLARPWPICLDCYEAVAEEPKLGGFLRQELMKFRPVVAARYAEAPPDREHALLLGVEALHFAEILALGRAPVDDLLRRSDALLAAAPTLTAAGAMKHGEATLLEACVGYHRARIAELRGDVEEAGARYEAAAARAADPWSEHARDALARIGSDREAKAARRRLADLRERVRAAQHAGDTEDERAAIVHILAIEDDAALAERFAILECAARAPGWSRRAADAVRRGSKDPTLCSALAGEAVLRAHESPREALALFRLALHGGPLSVAASEAFAESLVATGRSGEAGRVYEALGSADPLKHLLAAQAFATDGAPRRALAAIESLLAAEVPLAAVREGYAIAATLAPPDVLRPIAEKVLARDPGHEEAACLLARLKEVVLREATEDATRARAEGLAAAGRKDWDVAVDRLAVIPAGFRDAETDGVLARSYEEAGRLEEALRAYDALPPSRLIIEGRARCAAGLRRFQEGRASVRDLVERFEDGEPALGEDPDLLGLLHEARGDLRGAAARYEDETLLQELAVTSRGEGDSVTELEALARLTDRYPRRAADVRDRLQALDGVVPVRAKGRAGRGLPSLVLCDTNVLVAELLEDPSTPAALRELRSPKAATRLRELRKSEDVRLAVTRTVARELRAVLLYRSAIQEDEDSAREVQAVLERAEGLAASLDVARVAGVVPRIGRADVERVRGFYRGFGTRLGRITRRKAARAPERASAIVRRRTGGRGPGLPESTDLRLLAEAASLADAPLAGIGSVGILSEDADFRGFREEIERAFGVRVY